MFYYIYNANERDINLFKMNYDKTRQSINWRGA